MKKKGLSLDREIVLQQSDMEGGFTAAVLELCKMVATSVIGAGIYDHLRHPSRAFTCTCDIPTETCVSCEGTCYYSCDGSCDCHSFGKCPH